MEVFYRRCLHTLLAISPDLRNSILYITANKPPLHDLIAKVVWHYFRQVQEHPSNPNIPLVCILARWLRSLNNPSAYTLQAGLQFYANTPSLSEIYIYLF